MSEVLGYLKSVVNATTATLAAAETFTGTAEFNGYPDVMSTCKSDVDGTLFFEFSDTGAFGGEQSVFPSAGVAVSGGIYEFHTAVKGPRYFRTRYVNGTSAQGSLRINTYYGKYRQGNSPINSSIATDADAIVVRSVDSNLDLSFGKFSGMSEDSKFGRVVGVDNNDNAVDIWAFADDDESPRADTLTFPATPQPLFFSSSSSSDVGIPIVAEYIDTAGLSASTTVTLNGTGVVYSGASGYDVNRFYVSGSDPALGKLYAMTLNSAAAGLPSDPSTVIAFAPQGYQQTQRSQFTVPMDKKIRIKHVKLLMARTSGAAGSATITLRVQDSGGVLTVKREYFITDALPVVSEVFGLVYAGGARIVPRLDSVSDINTQVSMTWGYELVNN